MVKNKQGANKDLTFPLAACTTTNIVQLVENTIPLDADIMEHKSENDTHKIGFFSDSATFDGVGRNLDCFAHLSVKDDAILRLHPFNLFEGSDTKQNRTVTLYDQKLLLRNLLNGMVMNIGGVDRVVEVIITGDYKGLDTDIGRQGGRTTSIGIHTTATLEDCSPAGHKGKEFSWETMGDKISWKKVDEFHKNNVDVIVEHLETDKKFSDIGVKHNNVTSNMTFEVKDLKQVIPGPMHTLGGLAVYILKLERKLAQKKDALKDPSIDSQKREQLDKEIENLSDLIESLKNQQLDLGAQIQTKLQTGDSDNLEENTSEVKSLQDQFNDISDSIVRCNASL